MSIGAWISSLGFCFRPVARFSPGCRPASGDAPAEGGELHTQPAGGGAGREGGGFSEEKKGKKQKKTKNGSGGKVLL